jgi:hypothetical protein
MRGSPHASLWSFETSAAGILLRRTLADFDGILTGIPTRTPRLRRPRITA